MRRIFAVLIAVLMIISVSLPIMAATPLSDDIVILYTNDIHTYIDGELSYDVLSGIKKDLQTKYKDVLLVDAGDHIQGTAYGSMDNGASIIKLMSEAKYDVATLGNHEFDYGMLGCMKIINDAQYPYISCNFYNEENGVRKENVLDSFKIFTCTSEKIAFVGITTPETFTKSTPAYFQDTNGNYIYGISGGDDGADLYSDVQKAIDDAVLNGATKVIALGHLGDYAGSSVWTSESTIKNVSGLDAFIDGHSHSTVKNKAVLDKNGDEVFLTQTGEYFNRIGIMVIDSDSGEISTDFIELKETSGGYELESTLYSGTELISDNAVKATKDAWLNEIDTQLDVVIGKTALTFDNYDENGKRLVRSQETNTGDFCADALYFLFDNMGMDVDAAIINGGSIRNNAVTGDITYKTCKQIHTFGNVACLQTVTGQQILDALEWGAKSVGEGDNGGFLHGSGLTYKIDTAVSDTTVSNDKGLWVSGPTGNYRVYDVKIYNKETDTWDNLDLNKKYNIAGYNYTLRDLGDGFNMFNGAVNVLDYVMEDYMVLANYIKGFSGAEIKATNSPLIKKYSNFKLDYSTVNGSGRTEISERIIIGGLENNVWISKYGNVFLNIKAEDLINKLKINVGDIVKLSFLDKELIVPVVPNYVYVDNAEACVILKLDEEGKPSGYISLAINMGNFAEKFGIATKKTDSEGNILWEAQQGVTIPIEVSFEMEEKEGYLAEVLLRSLTRTNDREDYSDLSDEEFANFRNINTSGVGKNRLYRTSSPINPEIKRNEYAMKALEEAGVTVIMNLADSKEEAEAYEGFKDSYYSEQDVIFLNLGVDFSEESFEKGLKKGLKFFAENKGVYAVHCNEGKDRAGFVSALLECLLGASYDEVTNDYMVTYKNYYGVEKGSDKYNAILNSNIVKTLSAAFEVDNLSEADLAKEAEEYILSLGLTKEEVEKLKENLSKDYVETPKTGDDTNLIVWTSIMFISLSAILLINKKRKTVITK